LSRGRCALPTVPHLQIAEVELLIEGWVALNLERAAQRSYLPTANLQILSA